MKKLIFILALAMITIAGSAQGFFRPVDKKLFIPSGDPTYKLNLDVQKSVWLFRPAVQLSAMQIFRDKETKDWVSTQFQSAGLGVSYQHFIESNGEPISNFGFNVLMLFDASDPQLAISPAVTFSFLQFVNAGVGYNIPGKMVFGLLGITYNFN